MFRGYFKTMPCDATYIVFIRSPGISARSPAKKNTNNGQIKNNKNNTADQTLQINLKAGICFKNNTVQLIKLFKHMGVTCLKQVCSLYGYFSSYIFTKKLLKIRKHFSSPANVQKNNSFQCW